MAVSSSSGDRKDQNCKLDLKFFLGSSCQRGSDEDEKLKGL